jgi:arsenite methyltransferase
MERAMSIKSTEKSDIRESVRDRYASVASGKLSNDSCEVRAVAAAFGYSDEELASLPAEANMGLSCGNPVAIAALRPGEVVVDLGCGGGLDVLLASKQVGPTGKAIGIDMTAEMLERAQTGAVKVGATNVEFHLATIDSLPLDDDSVDCIISNCVINLAPDKDTVFREMYRVLKPGGRLAISDIALTKPLPPDVQQNIDAYVGCISGAITMDDFRNGLQAAGFSATTVTGTGADLNAYAQIGSFGCCTSDSAMSVDCCNSEGSEPQTLHSQLTELFSQFDANDYAASVRVHAVKNAESPI